MVEAVHESLERLLRYAITASEGQRHAITDWKTLGRRLGVSSAVMHNWKKRGISADGALEAEAKLGCSASWLRSGRGPHHAGAVQVAETEPANWTDNQHSSAGLGKRGAAVAHVLSHPARSDAPLYAWEQLMSADLPAVFRVVLPDDALSPDLNAGDELVLDRSLQPAAGDIVLVRDEAGHHYARVYRARRAGEWVAYAENDDFEPLDAQREQLTIVAVCVQQLRHRRRL